MAATKRLSVTDIARALGRRMRGRAMDADARRKKYLDAAATVPAVLASSSQRWNSKPSSRANVMLLRGFAVGGERSGVRVVLPLLISLQLLASPARLCWHFKVLGRPETWRPSRFRLFEGTRTTATGALREVYRRMGSVPNDDLLCILHEDCRRAAVDSDASVRALSATCARNALAELEAGIPKGLGRVRYTKDDRGKGGVFDVRPGSKLYVPPTRRSSR